MYVRANVISSLSRGAFSFPHWRCSCLFSFHQTATCSFSHVLIKREESQRHWALEKGQTPWLCPCNSACKENSYQRIVIIKGTHRTHLEFFPSCAHARACALCCFSLPFHIRVGCTPAGSSVPGLLPAHGKVYFLVFQRSSASVSSAEVSEPWQLHLEQQQSPGCLTASGRPRTELLRRYCASKWHDMCSKASPEPAELGRAQTAWLRTGLQAARFWRARPRTNARGAQARLFLNEDLRLGGFRAGEGAGGLWLVSRGQAPRLRPPTQDGWPGARDPRAGPAHGASQHRGGQSSSYRVSKYFCCQEEACRQRTDLPRNSGPR